jgi:hypothetical protein
LALLSCDGITDRGSYNYIHTSRKIYILLGVVVVGVVGVLLLTHRGETPVTTPPQLPVAEVEKAGPSSIYPDPSRTSGFTNPNITQANIQETICNPNWSTKSIRPPTSYTTKLKRQQIAAWGLPGSTADYEEDHFISLELGGSPTDPRNLWPESYSPKPGAREKDVVENHLHEQVCAGTVTLEDAQVAIVTDWYKVYLQIHQ